MSELISTSGLNPQRFIQLLNSKNNKYDFQDIYKYISNCLEFSFELVSKKYINPHNLFHLRL